MAGTTVSERCLMCNGMMGEDIHMIYVNKVILTRSGYYSNYMRHTPEKLEKAHKVRIRHIPGGTPKGAMHEICWSILVVGGADDRRLVELRKMNAKGS